MLEEPGNTLFSWKLLPRFHFLLCESQHNSVGQLGISEIVWIKINFLSHICFESLQIIVSEKSSIKCLSVQLCLTQPATNVFDHRITSSMIFFWGNISILLNTGKWSLCFWLFLFSLPLYFWFILELWESQQENGRKKLICVVSTI